MNLKALVYSIISGLILSGCSDNQNESFSYAVKQNLSRSDTNAELSLVQANLMQALVFADLTIAFKNFFPTEWIVSTESGEFLNSFYPGWIKTDVQSLEYLYSRDPSISKKYVFLENCVIDEKYVNKEYPSRSYVLCKSEGTKDSRAKLYFQYYNATTIGYDHYKKGFEQMYFCRFDGRVSQHLSFSDCMNFPPLNLKISTFIKDKFNSNDSLKKLLVETEKNLTYEEKLACNDAGSCSTLMEKSCYAPFLKAAKKVNVAIPKQISEEKLKILCK